MKKILGIVVLYLLLSNNSFANNSIEPYRENVFNKWLFDNGHREYIEITETEVCKAEPKYSNLWYYNKCDQPQYKNNLKIKFFESFIPADHSKSKDAKNIISILCYTNFLNLIYSLSLEKNILRLKNMK